MGVGEMIHARIAAEGGDDFNPAGIQNPVDFKPVAADVVFPQKVDFVFPFLNGVVQADHILEKTVVGHMMSRGLADALVSLATESENGNAQFLLHFPGYGMDVVSDQAHGTGGKHGNHLGFKSIVGLLNSGSQLLFTAEDDLPLLHVGRKTIGHEIVVIRRGGRIRLVAPGEPGVKPAPDGTVGQIDNIAGGPHHHSLAPGVTTAPLADDAGDGSHIGLNFPIIPFIDLFVDNKLLASFPRHLGRIFVQNLFFYLLRVEIFQEVLCLKFCFCFEFMIHFCSPIGRLKWYLHSLRA